MNDIAMCSNPIGCKVSDQCRRALEFPDKWQSYLIGDPIAGSKCSHYWKVPMNPIKKNTVLYTKDGRRFSNAIVTVSAAGGFKIKTDYGNEVVINREAIKANFYIGNVARKDHKHYTK